MNLTNSTYAHLQTKAMMKPHDIVVLVLYCIIFVVGSLGNGIVIYYFKFKKKKSDLFDCYILNLGIADFIASSFTSAHYIFNIISLDHWNIGLFMCKTVSAIGPCTVNVSAWIVTSIALERYRGITKPLQRYSLYSIKYSILFIWSMSILTLIPYIQAVKLIDNKCRPFWSSPHFEFVYSLVTLFIQSVIPSFAMCYIYFTIRKTVQERDRNLKLFLAQEENKSTPRFKNSLSTKSSKRNHHLYKMLALALTIFILCLIPYNTFYSTSLYIVMILTNFTNKKLIDTLIEVNVWSSLIVVMNSCFNFFVYAGMDKEFRSFCKNIVIRNNSTLMRQHKMRNSKLPSSFNTGLLGVTSQI